MAQVTSITVIAGAAGTVHVTVDDQNGNPLPPADCTWALPTGITATPDTTGFVFTAAASLQPGTSSGNATYSGPGASGTVVGPELSIVVEEGVTGLAYTSP